MKRLLSVILLVMLVGAPATRAADVGAFESLRGRDGFWRVGKDRGGAWWFIRPDGKNDFLNSVTTVQPHLAGRDPKGPHYAARDWDGRSSDGPGMDRWAEAT